MRGIANGKPSPAHFCRPCFRTSRHQRAADDLLLPRTSSSSSPKWRRPGRQFQPNRCPAGAKQGAGRHCRGGGTGRRGSPACGIAAGGSPTSTRRIQLPPAGGRFRYRFTRSTRSARVVRMQSGLPHAVGVAAALGTPLCFSLAFFLWENWRGSSYMLNLLKCSLASAVFVAAGIICSRAGGVEWFAGATAHSAGMLVLSGLAGIVIGDTAALQSLKMIGARRYILVDSSKPFFSGFLGWLLLGERITAGLVIGMLVTTLGVVMVSLEEDAAPSSSSSRDLRSSSPENVTETLLPAEDNAVEAGSSSSSRISPGDIITDDSNEADNAGSHQRTPPMVLAAGFALAVAHALLDVGGSIITRLHGGAYTNLEVNTVRFGSAALILALMAALARAAGSLGLLRGTRPSSSGTDEPQRGNTTIPTKPMTSSAWRAVLAGCMLGTFFTPWLSNAALFSISYPVFATLVSVGPVYSLPLAWLVRRQPITPRATLGAFLAFAGIIPLYHLA